MADINSIEDLKHTFGVKPEIGDKLPNPKDVADKSAFYLKHENKDTWIKHKMINGKWYVEKVDDESRVIFDPVK